MKAFIIVMVLVLVAVAFMAFGLVTIRRESEVAMHIFTDEGFIRFRIISIMVGAAASLIDSLLLLKLYRLSRASKDTASAHFFRSSKV